MDHLFIKKSPTTPQIDFKSSGKMSIKGSLLPEDPKRFFKPLFSWIDNVNTEEVGIDIRLNYINTSSSKRVIELIKSIDRNRKFKKINLKWYYEADDADMLEFGELIQRNLKKINVEHIECDDLDES